jgi:hypothetical protein
MKRCRLCLRKKPPPDKQDIDVEFSEDLKDMRQAFLELHEALAEVLVPIAKAGEEALRKIKEIMRGE